MPIHDSMAKNLFEATLKAQHISSEVSTILEDIFKKASSGMPRLVI